MGYSVLNTFPILLTLKIFKTEIKQFVASPFIFENGIGHFREISLDNNSSSSIISVELSSYFILATLKDYFQVEMLSFITWDRSVRGDSTAKIADK